MIFGSSRRVRVFAYPRPADLRKGYDGLYGIVTNAMGCDVLGGDVFLFVNRRRKGCKVLVWDGTGLCIFQKRLETAKLHDVDPAAYLRAAAIAADRGEVLLPWQFTTPATAS